MLRNQSKRYPCDLKGKVSNKTRSGYFVLYNYLLIISKYKLCRSDDGKKRSCPLSLIKKKKVKMVFLMNRYH